MKSLFINAIIENMAMIPFLLIIYGLVEWFENRFGASVEQKLQKTAKVGPVLGAAFGCIPQCGFSVVASALYARRIITTGTLLAVFLATSDEAVPVLLAQPHHGRIVIALLATKFIIGLTAGYLIDLALRGRQKQAAVYSGEPLSQKTEHTGCCRHGVSGNKEKLQWLIHPMLHTAKIFAFIVITTFGINCLLAFIGEESFNRILFRQSILQPLLTALVGLIPNCAASVAIAQVFLKGGLSYGSAVAGLCSSAGIGILVLLKENHDTRDTIRVLLLLVGISTVAGMAIQLLYG